MYLMPYFQIACKYKLPDVNPEPNRTAWNATHNVATAKGVINSFQLQTEELIL
jgi:hypothetical protein